MVYTESGTECTPSRVGSIVIELARMTLRLNGRVDVGGRDYLLWEVVVYAVAVILVVGMLCRGLVLILDFNGFVTSHPRLGVLARAVISDARFTHSLLLCRSVLVPIVIYLLLKLRLNIFWHDYSCRAAFLCDHWILLVLHLLNFYAVRISIRFEFLIICDWLATTCPYLARSKFNARLLNIDRGWLNFLLE